LVIVGAIVLSAATIVIFAASQRVFIIGYIFCIVNRWLLIVGYSILFWNASRIVAPSG
jgi:hypothetical protein